MSQDTPHLTLQEIASQTRYPLDAFHFVRRGLDFTVHRMHQHPELLEEAERHVSGKDLSEGLRDFALEQYGQLARTMFVRWHIHRTEDFGHIVFAMVNGGLMQATENDSIRDFDGGFDFDQAFNVPIPVEDVVPDNAATESAEHD